MSHLKNVILPGFALVLLVTGSVALAQLTPTAVQPVPPIPLGSSGAVSGPAPEWLVWRAFHDSLEFYGTRSPNVGPALLGEHVGLLEEQAAAVLTLGHDYLRELSLIDEHARSDIRARYQPNVKPRFVPENTTLISGNTEDGSDLHEVLAANGFIATVEQRRSVAFNQHRQRLIAIVGAVKFAKLEAWIRADVAPNVAVVTSSRPVPAPLHAQAGFRPNTPAPTR